MAFDYSYVLPPTGPSQNEQVREMFDDVRDYVNTLISGGGTGAPDDSQYVTLATDANLINERVLTAGTGISLTDNGAGSTIVVANTGVLSITTTNVNSSFSPSSGSVVFSFSVTPTFSSIILQSATGAIGIAPSATPFTSYNLTLPLDTGTSGYFLQTNGATPTATLTWAPPGGVTDIHGTTNQINVSATVGSVTLSTPQDIHTSADVQFLTLRVGAGSASDAAIKINDVNTGFYQGAGVGDVNLILDGGIATIWTAADRMLWNTGPIQSGSFIWRDAAGSHPTVTINPPTAFTSYTLTLPTDDGTSNQVLSTDGSGVLSWQSVTAIGGANTALSNLASVAINTTLVSDTDNTDDLGTDSISWKDIHLKGAFKVGSTTVLTPTTTSLTAPVDLFVTRAQSGGIVELECINTSNTASSAARLRASAGGSSAGDAYTYYDVQGVTDWSLGVDNSDGDSLVASKNSTLGTNNVWKATTAGEITQPLQPSFLVEDGAGASNVTGDGTVYTMVWGTEIYDQGGDFATNTFTAPVDGRYLLIAELVPINIGAAHTSRVTSIVTTNRTYSTNHNFSLAQTVYSTAFSVIADMDANDTATVTYAVSGSTKVVDFSSPSHFSGSLIN